MTLLWVWCTTSPATVTASFNQALVGGIEFGIGHSAIAVFGKLRQEPFYKVHFDFLLVFNFDDAPLRAFEKGLHQVKKGRPSFHCKQLLGPERDPRIDQN